MTLLLKLDNSCAEKTESLSTFQLNCKLQNLTPTLKYSYYTLSFNTENTPLIITTLCHLEQDKFLRPNHKNHLKTNKIFQPVILLRTVSATT